MSSYIAGSLMRSALKHCGGLLNRSWGTTTRLGIQFRTQMPRMCTLQSMSMSTDSVKIAFIEESNDSRIEVDAPVGKTVLDVAIDHNIDIEGACGGELACSTCHVILSQELFDKLPAKELEEEDMLDLAWGLTDT